MLVGGRSLCEDDSQEEAPEAWPEFNARAERAKKAGVEKNNKTARIARVRCFKIEHGLLKGQGITARHFVEANPAAAATAVELVDELLMELYELQDKTNKWLEADVVLGESGREPLFDQLSNAVLCEKVQPRHCVWAELSTTFKNM
jgi:hypothetical protein